MADLLTALDQVLATPEAQALSLDSDGDRDRLRELVMAEVADLRAARADVAELRAVLYTTLVEAADAQAEVARLRAVVEAVCKQLATLVDHFDAMDGEEDSTLLATDLQAISDGLRAALEKP